MYWNHGWNASRRDIEGGSLCFAWNIDRDMAVAERFQVMSIPTVLVLRESREVERLDGLINEPDLAAAFERASRA